MSERAALSLLLVPLAVYGVVIARGYDGGDYLRGDCPYYHWTAVSLLKDRDIDLANQIPGGLSFHFDQVSLDLHGRVVPKHPVALPIAALPFVAAFGRVGTLVFNVVALVALLAAMYGLARQVAGPWVSAMAAALTGTFSFLPHYAWNFSPDLFATLAMAAGFLALAADSRHWMCAAAGGLLVGIGCAAKPAVVVMLPGALLLTVPAWRARVLPAVAGLAVPLAAVAVLNMHLFGAPEVSAYDRITRLGEHGIETYSQRADFTQPVLKGLKRQLRHPTQGLLATSAVTLVSWLGLLPLARRRPWMAAAVTVSTAALVFLFARYSLWDSSHYGNRHLMPAVALAVVPLAALVAAAARFMPRPRVA